jgi:2-oxoisovalerate dehydrogenase E2 component (dihydrolipoyl transacylase)
VPAPVSGTLLAITSEEGKTVNAGAVLGWIGEVGEELEAESEATVEARDSRQQEGESISGRNFVSPVVARMAAEHEVDLNQISGTGLSGRITKRDMEDYLAAIQGEAEQPLMPAASSAHESAASTAEAVTAEVVRQPLSNMRRMIAEHMSISKRTSPHVTTIMETDMSAVVRHRASARRSFAEKGIALTYMAYFVAATARALKEAPAANSRFVDDAIVYNKRIHIGLAVALKQGLLVPVIRNVDELSLQGTARAIQDLAHRARENGLEPHELQGGTFTITNHGTGGSLAGTPIINQPQAGILGIGAIIKRPVVISSSPSLLPSADDAIVIRPMCYLSFSFDHRVLDGADADKFVSVIKSTLENWQ